MIHIDRKFDLLECISSIGSGIDEFEDYELSESDYFKRFLPIPEHSKVFEPNILLVLGGRGTGKTRLFNLLSSSSGREVMVTSTGNRALPSLKKTIWLTGYSKSDKHFPVEEAVQRLVTNPETDDLRAFWTGLLLGVILSSKEASIPDACLEHIPHSLLGKLRTGLNVLTEWLPLVNTHIEQLNGALDQFDEHLLNEDRWLFINYDELDRLTRTYSTLAAPIRELLQFWLGRWRRWNRIRPKIFLRGDLFQKDFLQFPDASKFQPHQMKLEWTTSTLYRLLLKRLANSGDPMYHYMNEIPGMFDQVDPLLGYIPTEDEEIHKQFIDKLVGPFMGADARKGITYRWVPNHLQDSGGRIAPRSLIKLFSNAAEFQKTRISGLTEKRLLEPGALQTALMSTSQDRILELNEEYPWLPDLQQGLRGEEVPTQQEHFLKKLEMIEWSDGRTPPTRHAKELLELLHQLGIVEVRSDSKVNVPEIYLYGFGMKRRGGIKRPR